MGLRGDRAPGETGVQDVPCLRPQFSLCWLGWLWIFPEMAQGMAEESLLRAGPLFPSASVPLPVVLLPACLSGGECLCSWVRHRWVAVC